VPVASQPYRLDVPVRADFVEVFTLLKAGRVAEALAAYRGPLLPGSDAPGLTEYRETLLETLRQAVIAHRDPHLLARLAALPAR